MRGRGFPKGERKLWWDVIDLEGESRGEISIGDLNVRFVLRAGNAGQQWHHDNPETGATVAAGIVEAHLRWSPGVDPADQRAVQALRSAVRLVGRPPGLTTITNDAEITDVIAEVHRAGFRVTQRAVAARGGWTIDELRGYLKARGKTWAESLPSWSQRQAAVGAHCELAMAHYERIRIDTSSGSVPGRPTTRTWTRRWCWMTGCGRHTDVSKSVSPTHRRPSWCCHSSLKCTL